MVLHRISSHKYELQANKCEQCARETRRDLCGSLPWLQHLDNESLGGTQEHTLQGDLRANLKLARNPEVAGGDDDTALSLHQVRLGGDKVECRIERAEVDGHEVVLEAVGMADEGDDAAVGTDWTERAESDGGSTAQRWQETVDLDVRHTNAVGLLGLQTNTHSI